MSCRGDDADADENWIEQGIDTRVRRFKKETLITIMSRTIAIKVGIDISSISHLLSLAPNAPSVRTQWECANVFLFDLSHKLNQIIK